MHEASLAPRPRKLGAKDGWEAGQAAAGHDLGALWPALPETVEEHAPFLRRFLRRYRMAATVKELAKGNHKELVKATLPGGKFKTEPCDMNCATCKNPCIDKKYLDM